MPQQPPHSPYPGQPYSQDPNQPHQGYGNQPYPNQPYPPQQPPESPKKKSRKWPWVLGGIIVLFGLIAVLGGGGEDADDAGAASDSTVDAAESTTIPPLVADPSGETSTVVYEVISDSATLNSVTWFDELNQLQQLSSVPAPWSQTIENSASFTMAGVTAQTDGTSVTCRVTVDGEVKEENTATGQYAVVNCTGVSIG